MAFADLVAALSKEPGMKIKVENDACAVRAGVAGGASATDVKIVDSGLSRTFDA